MLLNLLIIGMGGFLGSISRYLVYLGADNFYHKQNFPLGTLVVNASGSFFLGIILALSVKYNIMGRHTISHYLFVTGFLGAYTTFSTFSQDNLILLMNRNYFIFSLNVLSNLILGLGLTAVGYFAVKSI